MQTTALMHNFRINREVVNYVALLLILFNTFAAELILTLHFVVQHCPPVSNVAVNMLRVTGHSDGRDPFIAVLSQFLNIWKTEVHKVKVPLMQ